MESGKIVLLTNIELHEDLWTPTFAIVTWESEYGVFKKVLIKSVKDFNARVVYLGI